MRQLWYLIEELIALANFAFFDDGIDSSTKRKMISGLNRQGSDDPPKRLQLDPSVIPVKEIPDFVTSKTLTFLTFLDWMVISLDTLILTAELPAYHVTKWEGSTEEIQKLFLTGTLAYIHTYTHTTVVLHVRGSDFISQSFV